MKKLKLFSLLFAIALVTLLSSFIANLDGSASDEVLLTGRWKLNTLNIDPEPEKIEAISKYFNNHDENGYIEFTSEGEFVFEPFAGSKETEQKTGFWMFNEDQSKMIINDPEKGVFIADVKKLTKSFIQIEYSYVDQEGVNYKLCNYLIKM